MNRMFLLICILCAMRCNVSLAAEPPPPRKKPNFVFILVDDLGQRDLGCYGSTFYETPHLDKLAVSGMRFTDAYAACPVCSPTRASIMTGKFPVRTGITDYINKPRRNQPERWDRNTRMLPAPYADRLALEEVTLAEALCDGGYSTFFAGKWHLGPEGFWPEDQGFEVNRGGSDWGHPPTYFAPYNNPRLKDELPTEYLPYRLARETSRFIEQSRNKPFLAYLSFHVVHTPLMAPAQLVEKYKAKAKTLPNDRTTYGREVNDEKVRLVQDHAVYSAMIEAMDGAVGKVLDTLEEAGLADNTVIVFTSDNGGLSTSEGSPTSNLPLRAGKGWLYEGGLRVPLLVRWPGITKAGSTCNLPVVSPDYYPTLLEMANLPARPQQHVDGESIVPLLKGDPRERAAIFWHYPHYGNQGAVPGGVVRDGDWKLIEFYETGDVELYNLAEDFSERRNVATAEAERAGRMHEKLHRWLDQTGAVMPTQNPKYR